MSEEDPAAEEEAAEDPEDRQPPGGGRPSPTQGRRDRRHRASFAGGGRRGRGVPDESFASDLAAKLTAGGEARERALALLVHQGMVRQLSFEAFGCRVVQLAFDVADHRSAVLLASNLRGMVVEAIRSPHANYVVQKVIRMVAPQEAPFVVEEMTGMAAELVRHEYGCRVFCRLLEHAADDPKTVWLVDEVLVDTEELVDHTFGHHVVECALERGLPHQRYHIITVLRRNVLRNATQRNSAYVMEKALYYGSDEDRQGLAFDISNLPLQDLVALAQGQFGAMVLRAVQRVPGPAARKVENLLNSGTAQAQLRAARRQRRMAEVQAMMASDVQATPIGALARSRGDVLREAAMVGAAAALPPGAC